jgi:predicted DNA-binding transcriptional regulator AlpA
MGTRHWTRVRLRVLASVWRAPSLPSGAVPAKRATKTAAKSTGKKRAKRKPEARRPFCYMPELMEALGVSRSTIHKYVQMRLLPAPVMVSDGKQGVRCRWTLIAIDHAAFILEQQYIGYTLVEISEMIAARWGTLDKLPRKDDPAKPTSDPG